MLAMTFGRVVCLLCTHPHVCISAFFSVRDELEREESIFDLLRIIYWIEKCEQLLLLQCYSRSNTLNLIFFDIFNSVQQVLCKIWKKYSLMKTSSNNKIIR